MNFVKKTKSAWPVKNAVIISETSNLHMLLRELLRSYGWNISKHTHDPKVALNMVNAGDATCIIVDDSQEMPASSIVRQLIQSPAGYMTPILTFLLDQHKEEAVALKSMASLEVVMRPITPSKFVPAFLHLVSKWESPQLTLLRLAYYNYKKGGTDQKLAIMNKLSQVKALRIFSAQALAYTLTKKREIKEAEKVLLDSLKLHPRSLSTMICLADLYMQASMPKLATRLFIGAKNAFSDTGCILPDLAQAAVMIGDFDAAIGYLNVMRNTQYMDRYTTNFLVKLNLAMGQVKEVQKLCANKKSLIQKYEKKWNVSILNTSLNAS